MKIELDNVETIIDSKVGLAEGSTSAYIYVPKNLVGRKVKICVLKK